MDKNSKNRTGISSLSDSEKKKLLEIARKTIEEFLNNSRVPEFKIESDKLKKKSGAFVTIKKEGNLRGCIGLIQAQKPLYKAVQDMAVSASTKDPRFPPVTPEEVEKLTIEISVLTPFSKVGNPENIEVGRDGLMIRKGFRSGLLLPQVPVEQNWDRKTFLEHTCYKAGLSPDAWKDAELMKFQALVFSEDELN